MPDDATPGARQRHESTAVVTTYGATVTPAGPVEAAIDGGDMDCGSGLLLLITRAMRRLPEGGRLGIRSTEPSVADDLPVWAELTGHHLDAQAEEPGGASWFLVRRAAARAVPDTPEPSPGSVFTRGERTPVGHRLWVYTNFDCNLACGYCCARSSPKAEARRVDADLARAVFDEFRSLGGREVLLTGGEPFMNPHLGELVALAEGLERTVLTNAMVFGRGARLRTLTEMDRSVVLQVSLDSATPDLHDAQRGPGAWARAMEGIGRARALGFRVRVAATHYAEDHAGVAALHDRLDTEGIAPEDRIVRPVAAEGFAASGMHVSVDSLEPEPTITADGAWWHPVAVTNPNLRVADAPLPLAEVFGVVRDAVAVQDAAERSGREVFRCA
jgi:uncharacterized Fe-S cluster-containing radical SAM superfamily protein/TusA-related sulfurtransferase